ncbi:MAG: PVC-type heme-binding CxxCH protein [Pirellulaceae bacterium]
MAHTPRNSIATLVWLSAILAFPAHCPAAELELRRGDHICLVGNALGERLQHANHWETLLYQRFPDLELVVRNLCFPGDEPLERLRSLNFGSPDDHLRHSRADVVIYFFGFNESFAGEPGLKAFRRDLTRVVRDTLAQDYSGRGAPRVVLVSPIAHEDRRDPNLPDGRAHNEDLRKYSEAMQQVARETGAGFVDLFGPTQQLFAESPRPLTINGVHLSDDGYRALAPVLDAALFGEWPAGRSVATTEALKKEIDDKNFHWWHRYRAVNGYSIYGTRGTAGSDGTYRNREVMERERAILDEMCANRDRRIWSIAQGQKVPAQVDDSNTLPFLVPKTNVGGTSDPNRKAGKLGSLDYLPAEEQRKHFQLAPGYEIDLVASEEDFPELANPVAINFDNRGRLWVATMPSYPQWQPKTPLDDKLLILEDDNGDGRADRCRVFAGGLHQPTGFELGMGGAFVAQQPDVLFLRDTDGDDRADVRERRLIGFDSADSHHGLAAFEWGPDGALYFQEGTFKQSQVESPYGLTRLGDAGVWRYEPRTEKFRVHVSLAFANPWGHVFDAWGQNFVADASPGFNYWATPISGRVDYPDKHPGGSRARNLDWGGSRGNRDYPVFVAKRIRPTSGCEFVSSRQFPPEAQGNFLVNNVIGDLGVLQHTVHDAGSGYGGQEVPPLVLSTHGNFRPVDLQFGPDGALYIADWHNALIGHLQHNLREPYRDHMHGRIWRVRYASRPLLVPPRIAGEPVERLLELLREPEDRTRYRVRRELAERPTAEVVAALDPWWRRLAEERTEPRLLLEGLWVYQTHNVVQSELLERLLQSPEPRARAAATRVLCEWRDRVPGMFDLLAARIRDEHPRVRLEAVRACSFVGTLDAMELALEVLNYEMDVFLDYTLYETIRVLDDTLSRPRAVAARPAGHDHVAHDHASHQQPGSAAASGRPTVFLGKSPRIVAYQLARLSAPQLVQVERQPDDARYLPVYEAIALHAGVARQDRAEAVAAVARFRGASLIPQLLATIEETDRLPANEQLAVRSQLAGILLSQPVAMLVGSRWQLEQAAESPVSGVRPIAFAALASAESPDAAWQRAARSEQGRLDFLQGVPLITRRDRRLAARPMVESSLAVSEPLGVRRAALEALATIDAEPDANFRLAAAALREPGLRVAAVRVMLAVPASARSPQEAAPVVERLVRQAERTPVARRTTDDFLDAMQLADQLIAKLPADTARGYRDRLRAVTVRVVRIKTVHEEMRYDTPHFAVEAGRPAQLVLQNEDLMPHNLVITQPGKLRDVAMAASDMPPQPDAQGRTFVPPSSDVLFATPLVEPHKQTVLTFEAPHEPGQYPYVCTFPNHWMRMYGVMVVVPDLDAWLADPVPPVDPLGNSRAVVQAWTIDDLQGGLPGDLRGRSPEIGRKLFAEANCVQCHKVRGEGGTVGPDLTEVLQRWKGDHAGVLREMLDPSQKIDPKYALFNVQMADGRVYTGLVSEQNAETITLITNPDKPQPQVLEREEIEEMVKMSTSMMPKGLLDRFTRDEIFELLSFLAQGP